MRLFLALLFLCSPIAAQQAADSVAPEAAGAGAVASSDEVIESLAAKTAGQPVSAQNWMISAANPLAVEAGAQMLRAGGTAADAMIAVQVVLGLVEPQSSGLGGGAFLVWYDGNTGALTTLDGRETAPLSASPKLFQDAAGQPLPFFEAVIGGRSVGVPGTPALLEEAHKRWGKLAWGSHFNRAIELSEQGFAVSPRLAGLVAWDAERLALNPETAAYFLPGGTPIAQGAVLKNPAYAKTLRAFLKDGGAPFYTGKIAGDIAARVGSARNPGDLTPLDFAIYRVKERVPVCAAYRGYDICGMGPPSSGGISVGQILGVLDPYDLTSLGLDNPESWRLIGDATRLAFADRGRYIADSDYVPVPVKGLVDPLYLRERAQLLAGEDALPLVAPGQPEFDHTWADDTAIERPSTSHISIVDQYGNALSMTTTIENAFGSRLMVGGFLLNNELTDFSFRSHVDGVPVANRVEPGKRPRSSMAPTIVMKDGKPVLVIGSPGGSRIIPYVAKTIIAHLDWGMDVQEAIGLPHLVNRFGAYDLEAGTSAETLATPLTAMGFETNKRDLTSGLHAIAIGPTLQGGADNRREGVVLGD